MNRRVSMFWIVSLIAWWVAIAIGSHWPRLDMAGAVGLDNDVLPLGVDKWVHTSCYTGLAWLALTCGLWRRRGRWWWLLTIETLVLYALIDETLQYFCPGRSVGYGDAGASTFGIILGSYLWAIGQWLTHHDGSFVAHTRTISVLTLLSRCFGLVRDWAMAWVFGFGSVLDAFFIAFTIPNLFRRLFGEGALAAAFVPQYSRLLNKHPSTAMGFATRVLVQLTKWLVGITIAGLIVLLAIDALVPMSDRTNLIVNLTMLTLWYAPLVCVAAILGAILQVHGRFGPPAAAPVILNVFIIVSCMIVGYALPASVSMEWRIRGVCIAIVLAGVVQAAWQWLLRPRPAPFAEPPHHAMVDDAMTRLMQQWGPTVAGLAVFQVNVLMDSMIAWFFSAPPNAPAGATMNLLGWHPVYPMLEGAVSVLNTTARLYEFPTGVFGIAVATAIFPQLSAAAEDTDRFSNLLREGLRLTLLIGLPASIGLILVRMPLATAIYYRGGKLTADDAARVAWVLTGYAPAVWAYSMNHVLTRTFYAQHNTLTPMRVAVAMVALNIVLNCTLIWPLGAAGLAWATAICAMLQCVILLRLVKRYVPTPIDRDVVISWGRSAIVTLAMSAAVWAVVQSYDLSTLSRLGVVSVLLGATVAGSIVVVAAAMLLRMPEMRMLLRRG
ncbi:MAG: murein biosynthesis integral membrane protein MurJ [Planctomycetes bacterium]|nr:murein biosynthesis integral membrane protein MurJ [Planctomycetota bacterium]